MLGDHDAHAHYKNVARRFNLMTVTALSFFCRDKSMEKLNTITSRFFPTCTGRIYLLLVLILHEEKVAGYPYEIIVSDIKSTSATLQWKSTEVLVDEYMIECRGNQKYRTHDDEVHNTEMHVRSQYVPKGLSDVIIGGLRPYYNYSCVIGEEVKPGAQVFNGRVSDPVVFCTDVAAPAELPPPKISKEDSTTYIWLCELDDNKSGPIKGYSVQFHLISDPVLNDIPFELAVTDPFGKLAPVNIEHAKVSEQPLSFQMMYTGRLPKHIHIDHDLMSGALRNGAVYRVIVVPYVESRSSEIIFTPSQPSVSFVAVGLDRNAFEPGPIEKAVPLSLSTKIAIIIGILLPFVCLSYMCCVGAFVLAREYCHRHDKDSDYNNSCCARCGTSVKRGSSRYFRHLVCCNRCARRRKDGFELLKVDDSMAAEDDLESQYSPTLPHHTYTRTSQPKIKKARLYKIDSGGAISKSLKVDKQRLASISSGSKTKAQLHKSDSIEARMDQKPYMYKHDHKLNSLTSKPAQKLSDHHASRSPAVYDINDNNASTGNSFMRERSNQHEPQRSKQHEPQRSKQHEPQRTKQHEPQRSKQHEPQRSKQHEPQTSKQYKPQTSKKHEPQRSKQHEPQRSKQYEPQTSKQYEPQRSKQHEPQRSKQHEPQTSKQHEPQRSKQHEPQRSKQHEPQRSSEYRILKGYHYQHHHHHYSESRPKPHKSPPKPSGHHSSFHSQPVAQDRQTKAHNVHVDRRNNQEHTRYPDSNHRAPPMHGTKPPTGFVEDAEKLWECRSPSESSGSTIINEENDGHALDYTTSASILENPHQTDNFFSPYEEPGRHTVELVKGFTRKREDHHTSPQMGTPRKTSSDRFEFISLSSGTSLTDNRAFGPSLDILH